MDLVLLFIELKKLAGRGLRTAAAFVLPLAILNLSLGATVMLATPPGFEDTLPTTGGQEIELVHMQMFGGLIHLHDGSGFSHVHSAPALPPGVTEQDLGSTAFQIVPDWSVSINSSDSVANFWQDLTTRGQVNSEFLHGNYLAPAGRIIPGSDPTPPNPYLGVPLKPPIL